MKQLSRIAVLILSTTTFARAQQILFTEDFEAGFDRWNLQSPWQEDSEPETCGAMAAPFPSSTHAAYFGYPGTGLWPCWYAATSGAFSVTLLTPVAIPEWSDQVELGFGSWESIECFNYTDALEVIFCP